MKLLTTLLGAGVAWCTYRFAPDVFPQLIAAPGFAATFSGLGVALAGGWTAVLTKLNALDKLDDLPQGGAERVSGYGAASRNFSVAQIVVHFAMSVLCLASIYIANIPAGQPAMRPAIGYVLCVALGYWLGSFRESWACFKSVDETRRSLIQAQAATKQRVAYLAQLRKDITEKPIDMHDRHLLGYTSDSK
ncbi:hypothetical protein [Massilia rubra]|uniref:Uncharacterized protein n=1 Tax=Massilia rubra TaxID=2607910 RepID=A0ABX0LL69_9BURK|nr:hypothetical protein [Massilia rubra]NHZ35348.1 hypothetical protein [Massilia rubra]